MPKDSKNVNHSIITAYDYEQSKKAKGLKFLILAKLELIQNDKAIFPSYSVSSF